eukprot:1134762-Pelagomonas_calceolata.AAC.3
MSNIHAHAKQYVVSTPIRTSGCTPMAYIRTRVRGLGTCTAHKRTTCTRAKEQIGLQQNSCGKVLPCRLGISQNSAMGSTLGTLGVGVAGTIPTCDGGAALWSLLNTRGGFLSFFSLRIPTTKSVCGHMPLFIHRRPDWCAYLPGALANKHRSLPTYRAQCLRPNLESS